MACVIDGIDDRWIREIRQEVLNYILSQGEKGGVGAAPKLFKRVYSLLYILWIQVKQVYKE
jgi:hypothetical protein